MKLLPSNNDRLEFQLGQRECRLLLELLALYPQVPAAHFKLSKSARIPDPEASQKLLDDAVAEQREETRKELQALLADPKRFRKKGPGHMLSLSPAELEWLLQVLNDIRVGSWVLLGSPEDKIGTIDEDNAPHVWAMELAGLFQMQFLDVATGTA